ncbi:MAG: DUF308 domain-containing protein [Clostridia bacterium]|nr:DUF308 domain-containing protein [Clostridia bacterium]
MNSEFKKSFYVSTALFILLGGVMAAWSNGAPQIVTIALGCALAVYGAVRVLMCCKKNGLNLGNGIIRALTVLLLGVLVLRWNEKVTLTVITIAGAALIADGVIKAQMALALKKAAAAGWKRDLIGALVFIAIGVFLMVDPFAGKKAMIIITGAVLILSGIANLWLAHELKKTETPAS